jgi:hypothetical protein
MWERRKSLENIDTSLLAFEVQPFQIIKLQISEVERGCAKWHVQYFKHLSNSISVVASATSVVVTSLEITIAYFAPQGVRKKVYKMSMTAGFELQTFQSFKPQILDAEGSRARGHLQYP